jgi:uncharacterized protein YbjT (DUF2867 family)
VVNLSSIGAELESGAGPISGLHDVEGLLDDAGASTTHLRPGFFFENLLWQMDAIRSSRAIALPVSGDRRCPMIATRDIGRVAADRLADGGWTGQSVEELHGPAELSFNEVAEILSEALGRKITFVRCEPQQMRQAIIEHGVSENVADAMLEMYAALEAGKLRSTQPRRRRITTPTTLAEFAHEVLAPLLSETISQ